MNLKLFSNHQVPQLGRLFASTSADDKSCYLVKLNAGYTETDLNKCLNFQATTGAGYFFDAARAASTGVCTVLAKGTNCTRAIDSSKISVSDCTLTALASGMPTHLILGGILPICLTLGTDAQLAFPTTELVYEATGFKTTVTVPAFTIPLGSFWSNNASWLVGGELGAFSALVFTTGSFTDYTGVTWTVTGNAAQAADGLGINLGTSGVISSGVVLDVSQSFTIECDYHQTGTSTYAEWMPLCLNLSSISDRFMITFDRSNETGFGIWNNVGGGGTGMKVIRPIANFAAMKTTTPGQFKYTYDASTFTHSIYFNGVLLDSFVYQNMKPVFTGVAAIGGYGGQSNAAYAPIIDRYRIRKGVF